MGFGHHHHHHLWGLHRLHRLEHLLRHRRHWGHRYHHGGPSCCLLLVMPLFLLPLALITMMVLGVL